MAGLTRPSMCKRQGGWPARRPAMTFGVVAISRANAILSLAGAVSGYFPVTNQEAPHGRPDGILQQHPGADGGGTDRPRRARLRHLFPPAQGTADLHHR